MVSGGLSLPKPAQSPPIITKTRIESCYTRSMSVSRYVASKSKSRMIVGRTRSTTIGSGGAVERVEGPVVVDLRTLRDGYYGDLRSFLVRPPPLPIYLNRDASGSLRCAGIVDRKLRETYDAVDEIDRTLDAVVDPSWCARRRSIRFHSVSVSGPAERPKSPRAGRLPKPDVGLGAKSYRLGVTRSTD